MSDVLDGIPVTVKWKQPFVDWINEVDDYDEPWTVDDPENNGTVYLLPDKATDPESLLKEYFGVIFAEELQIWEFESSAWPQDRSFAVFEDWLEVSFPEMVVDLTHAKANGSEKDVDRFISEVRAGEHVEGGPPETPRDYAQDLIYDAWETERREKRIELAHRALAAFPDCADAFNLLAEEAAATDDEALELRQKALAAGERVLGPEKLKNTRGYFWGSVETRPFMRAKMGLAQSLWKLKRHEEALTHYRQLLELNPNDNQGVRYMLLSSLGELGRFDEISSFIEEGHFKDEASSEWDYMKALLSFVKEGPSSASRDHLQEAIKENRHVPVYLLGEKRIPMKLPDTTIWHGEDEAILIAHHFQPAWKKVPGALDWLKNEIAISKTGRNDPCPCGSGKKLKKCCLGKYN